MEIIDHFTHFHPLTLLECEGEIGEENTEVTCNGCRQFCTIGPIYACTNQCGFYLHRSCAELPQEFQNPFHPHPLTLNENILEKYLECDSCSGEIEGFFFYCEVCKLFLDVDCALLIPTKEGRKQLQHVTHIHPLTLIECEGEIGEDTICNGCGDLCTIGPIYGCTNRCDFYLHRSCAELPQEFQNPIHPHPLTLHLDYHTQRNATLGHWWDCYSCSKVLGQGFFYQCKVCKFNLDVDCALFIPTKEEGRKQLQHVTHFHPLTLTEGEGEIGQENTEIICNGCAKSLTIGPIYACTKCLFYLHRSCTELPQEFQNPIHPHPLTLHLDYDTFLGQDCYSCSKDLGQGFFYQCKVCKFNLDVDCALFIPTKEEGHKQLQHVTHFHPLTLAEGEGEIGEENTKIICNGCAKSLTIGPIYACTKCLFYLHRSCTELPQEFQNPIHPHPLTLHLDFDTRRNATLGASCWDCYSCSKDLGQGFFYQCKVCKFNLDVDCALFIPTKEEGRKQLQHVTHFHPLTLTEGEGEIGEENTEIICNGCAKSLTIGPIYACTKCLFYLHRSCTELPQEFQNPIHPHPFTLHLDYDTRKNAIFEDCWSKCYSCSKDLGQGFFYQCKVCKFDLDVDCALFIPTKEEGRKQLQHVTHFHPLTLTEGEGEIGQENTEIICNGCAKSLTIGPIYACTKCLFYLHRSCTELPQEFQNPIHPHPLTLHLDYDTFLGQDCYSCSKDIKGCYSYECEVCKFNLDVDCALFIPTKEEGHKQLQHVIHFHPLTLTEGEGEIGEDNTEIICNGCAKSLTIGPIYACTKCLFYLHRSCTELPQEFQNPIHPHPLTLHLDYDTFLGQDCYSCSKDIKGYYSYECEVCKFNLDVDCALFIPTKEEGRKQLQHVTHFHPLTLTEGEGEIGEENTEIICNGCAKSLTIGPIYACTKCLFYLHKSCTELPQEFQNPIHPHPLTLHLDYDTRKNATLGDCWSICYSCSKDLGQGFFYQCKVCKFNLDVDCALFIPTKEEGRKQLQHVTHFHPLTLTEGKGEIGKENTKIICNGCAKSLTIGPIYACTKCLFYLHRSCTELPQEFQNPIHPHPLTLHLDYDTFLGQDCYSCSKDIKGCYSYECEVCKFNLDVDCALFIPTKEKGRKQLQHVTHFHRLTLTEGEGEIGEENTEIICNGCAKSLTIGPIYACTKCLFYLHRLCTELPQEFQNPIHPHPLTLHLDYDTRKNATLGDCWSKCYSCSKDLGQGFFYQCMVCKFNLDVDCALFIPTKEEGRKQLQHVTHFHPLTLTEGEGEIGEENTEIICNGCAKSLTIGPIYACTKCLFYLHRSCTELPQEFQNSIHPHPLTLHWASYTLSGQDCYSCSKDIKGCYSYECEVCKFKLDVDCALLIPTKEEGRKQLQHVTHFHLLTLIECELCEGEIREENIENKCKGCAKSHAIGPIYACTECCFYLHTSCAELPQEFQNPFHPHPLTLHWASNTLSGQETQDCYSCSKDIKGCYSYECEVCKFKLDVDCALLIPTKEEGCKQLQHVTHLHPLTLVDNDIIDDSVKCLVCGKHCLGPCYGCNPCGRALHQPCAEFQFPQEIQTSIHPCPLALKTKVTNHFWCGGCSTSTKGMAYFCEPCNFQIDVECALSTNIVSQGQEQFEHYSHNHPLALIDKMDDSDHQFDWHCFACRTCSLGPTYVCNKCKFFLHQSCAWFHPEIQYFPHSPHPLTLCIRPAPILAMATTQVKIPCNLCASDCNGTGITYQCRRCDLNLHVKCTALVPTVKYEDHHGHLLCLVELEKIDPKIKCNACNTCCDSWVLRCIECNFNLHVHCAPLPYTIKHKCHIDPLTLRESPVEEDDSDDEFYCDICEKQRDPRLPFYYCADCGLVAEIACVISEVILWLKGDYGNVDLRTSAGWIAGKVIRKEEAEQEIEVHSETGLEEVKDKSVFTLDHILNSFTEDENAELNDILKTREIDIISIRQMVPDESNELDLSLSLFGGKQYFRPDHSKTQPKSGPEYSKTFLKNEGEVVTVRDYMMKTISAGKKLFDEHNILDIPLLSNVAYREFMRKLESGPDYIIQFWKNEEVVSVRDYMVTRKLAPVLESLCATYGDVSTVEYTILTSRVKMVLIVILCGTIDSMCNTKVLDMSEDLILNWWNYLKLLQSVGFKIEFAFDHLKKVVHAYLGLQLREQEDKTLAQLDKDITMYSGAIKEFNQIIQGLKLKREEITSEQSTRKSNIIEECLREGSKLKWRSAGEGLQLKKLG